MKFCIYRFESYGRTRCFMYLDTRDIHTLDPVQSDTCPDTRTTPLFPAPWLSSPADHSYHDHGRMALFWRSLRPAYIRETWVECVNRFRWNDDHLPHVQWVVVHLIVHKQLRTLEVSAGHPHIVLLQHTTVIPCSSSSDIWYWPGQDDRTPPDPSQSASVFCFHDQS